MYVIGIGERGCLKVHYRKPVFNRIAYCPCMVHNSIEDNENESMGDSMQMRYNTPYWRSSSRSLDTLANRAIERYVVPE